MCAAALDCDAVRLIDDRALAVATVWTEAEGEPYQGKVAVAEVIRRRAALKYSSDGTIAGTVARRFQFSAWNDDLGDNNRLIAALNLNDASLVVQDCERAWDESANSALVPGAVLYHATTIAAPVWADPAKFVAQIGRHRFFKA